VREDEAANLILDVFPRSQTEPLTEQGGRQVPARAAAPVRAEATRGSTVSLAPSSGLHPAVVRAEARRRLAQALDTEPVFLDAAPGGYEMWLRGDLVFLLPAVPSGSGHAERAVLAARSAWLGRACGVCGRRLFVNRAGSITVQHASRCPGGRAVFYMEVLR
jgi:hypothetical protein